VVVLPVKLCTSDLNKHRHNKAADEGNWLK